ncbi:YwqG family protein [Amycolatopsis sp. OK19-0408]|uniref:YwqG family protein n=1 Tax=Amycolatopsis iheyensis TaxID=2945988 RepID=A0A9X2SL58_9PSEU|nr:YwqG family protein [Amycolatopsis iheyensis]MCR6484210.1 YwqG family protein [Amycolatopsis iheyensis]
MTSWRDQLSTLAHDRLPTDLATAWTGLMRPGIRLTPAGEGPRVARLGGDPELPAEAEWPTWPGEGPLNFVAALDCAALPREYLSIPLPAAGTLLFFYFDGDRRSVQADSAAVEDAEGSRVLFVPAEVPVTARRAPEGVVPYPAQEQYAEIVATAPERSTFCWTAPGPRAAPP